MKRLRAALLAACLSALGGGAASAVDLEIWQIQGAGMHSSLVGQEVTVAPSIVTAVAAGGFFVQCPEHRSDDDEESSDGLFVVSPATVRVGDELRLTGEVGEFYDFTRLEGPVEVERVSRGNPLPPAVHFGPDLPASTQPWPANELERFEGMRVEVPLGTVTGPSDRYGDAVVVASPTRVFREPGIAYPGVAGYPVFDGNPERFEIDPDGLGLNDLELWAGSWFRAVGVLAFSYGDYQLWPDEFELLEDAAGVHGVRPAAPGELSVGSQNLERLGESLLRTRAAAADEPRFAKAALQVIEALGAPHVVALQEVIGETALEELAAEIVRIDPSLNYRGIYAEAQDPSGIALAFLVRDSVEILEVEQLGRDATLSGESAWLFDRPPLALYLAAELEGRRQQLTVVNLHLRSLIDVDDPERGDWVRKKRHEQALWVSSWVGERQQARPEEPILLTGDCNAFQFSDGWVDVIAQLSGSIEPGAAVVAGTDEVDPDLRVLGLLLAPEQRYSYVYQGQAQLLDHALLSLSGGGLLRDVAYSRGNADAPEGAAEDPLSAARSSDHDGLVVFFGGPRSRRSTGTRP